MISYNMHCTWVQFSDSSDANKLSDFVISGSGAVLIRLKCNVPFPHFFYKLSCDQDM